MPSEEFVTVSAGGTSYSGFRSIKVEAGLKEAARTFHIEIAAEPDGSIAAWTFKAGTRVEISSNGDLLCTGYVDRYQPKLHEHSSAEVAVSGRSTSQDLIDSSAVHKTGHFKNKAPDEILQELDQAGVGVKTDQHLDKVPFYQIVPGETVAMLGAKLCASQGVTMCGQADGSILITKGGTKLQGALREGVNIKAGEADHNWAGRHSKVIVRGQRAIGHGADALEIEQIAEDKSVGRHRPIVVLHDGDIDKPRAKKRAKNRRDKEAGNALKANITVQGFRDDSGRLWEPGALVWLESQFLSIEQTMCIERVTFEQSRHGGSTAHLALVDPRAHGGTKSKAADSGDAWSIDPEDG